MFCYEPESEDSVAARDGGIRLGSMAVILPKGGVYLGF